MKYVFSFLEYERQLAAVAGFTECLQRTDATGLFIMM